MKLTPLTVSKPKEKNTEDSIKKAILTNGGYVIKNQASSTTGRGKPDLSACIDGKYYGIEVKRNNSKKIATTHQQVENLYLIARAGGFACWAKNADFLINDNVSKNVILPFDYQSSIDLASLNDILKDTRTNYVQLIVNKQTTSLKVNYQK